MQRRRRHIRACASGLLRVGEGGSGGAGGSGRAREGAGGRGSEGREREGKGGKGREREGKGGKGRDREGKGGKGRERFRPGFGERGERRARPRPSCRGCRPDGCRPAISQSHGWQPTAALRWYPLIRTRTGPVPDWPSLLAAGRPPGQCKSARAQEHGFTIVSLCVVARAGRARVCG